MSQHEAIIESVSGELAACMVLDPEGKEFSITISLSQLRQAGIPIERGVHFLTFIDAEGKRRVLKNASCNNEVRASIGSEHRLAWVDGGCKV